MYYNLVALVIKSEDFNKFINNKKITNFISKLLNFLKEFK